jgi:hypothetical protein
MRHVCAAFVLPLVLLVPARAEERKPGDPVPLTVSAAAAPTPSLLYHLLPADRDQTDGNAATLYYRAWATLAENKAFFMDLREAHWYEWLETPLEDLPLQEMEGKLALGRTMFQELEMATRCRRCDWQLEGRPEGIGLLLPEVQGFRSVGSMIASRARYHIARGNWEEALRSFRVGLGLARDLGRGPTFIHILVGVAIGNVMCKQLEEFVQRPGAPNLYWALAQLPRPFGDMRTALREERVMLERTFPMLKHLEEGPMTETQVQAGLLRLRARLDDFGVRRPTRAERLAQAALITNAAAGAKRALLAEGLPEKQLDAMPVVQVVALKAYRDYREAYDEALKWTYVPGGFRHPGFREAAKKVEAAGRWLDQLFFRGLLRALEEGIGVTFDKVHQAIGRLDRRLAALGCVEALRMHAARKGRLPAALADVTEVPAPPDPVSEKPFEYKVTGNVATLSAALPPGPKPPPQLLLTYEISLRPPGEACEAGNTREEIAMSRSVTCGALLLVLCAAGGCKKSQEQLVRDQLDAMHEATAVLESIQDDASAQRALPKLEKAAARLRAANAAALRSQPKGGDPNKALEKLNDPKVQAQVRQLMEAGLKMMGAQMQAVQRAPGNAEQIAAIMRKANVTP